MKIFTLLILGVSIVCIVASVSFAAPLTFSKINGPASIQFGPTYTYSTVVKGAFNKKDILWSASGGKVLKDWWDGNTYFCNVQWEENNSKDPAKIKVSGKDKESGEIKDERLFVSVQSQQGSRSMGGYQNLKNVGGKCLEIAPNELRKNGGNIQIWDCNNEIQQQWMFDEQGRLRNEGGKCLDVLARELKKDGGKVQAWECHSEIQQKWELTERGLLFNKGGKMFGNLWTGYE